jgi:hypothetical protein
MQYRRGGGREKLLVQRYGQDFINPSVSLPPITMVTTTELTTSWRTTVTLHPATASPRTSSALLWIFQRTELLRHLFSHLSDHISPAPARNGLRRRCRSCLRPLSETLDPSESSGSPTEDTFSSKSSGSPIKEDRGPPTERSSSGRSASES